MKPIVIEFEANCPCLWYIHDLGNGKWCRKETGDEIWGDQSICDVCDPLMEEYDKTCCFDERGCFEPKGWDSEEHMKAFNQKMIDLWEFLSEHLKGRFEVFISGFFSDVNSIDADSREPVL